MSLKDTINVKKATKISLITVSVLIALVACAVGVFFILIEPRVNIFPNDQKLDTALLTSYTDTVTILDADGKPLDDSIFIGNKVAVKIEDLPKHTADAFIAIEDKRFYSHSGIDYKRMASALWKNAMSRSFREGASTITQQLIKNTHLSNEKTLKRKLIEIRLARDLERRFDKDRILECYFNILYFGSGIRGLGTASRVFFDKSASELTVAQSAALASIINNPSKYSPYKNPDNLQARKNLVLRLMLQQGFISENDYDTALNEPLTFCSNKQNQFIEGVVKNACAQLNCSEKQLFSQKCTLKTSFDAKISDSARAAIKNADIEGNVRILVLDNSTGGIACDETNSNRYLNPKRSPASAIKPFISYAPALENGYNPLSQIADEPTVFGDYAPQNYKSVYRGYQSLTDCLIHSSNIAAVKLLQDVGIEKAKDTARAFGIDFEQSDDSLAIALGGMERGVTLSELANAYRTLANNGIYTDIGYVQSAESNESTVFKASAIARRAVNDDTAYLLTDILTQCAKSGTAKKLRNCGIIAAKTGTNGDKNGNYDCYCIAYTPANTIAVWIGANEKPLDNKITGAYCCNMIVDMFNDGALRADKRFTVPKSVAYYEIDNYELENSHEVYLADPLLPGRYRRRALLSKRHLPVQKSIDIIDYYDEIFWNDSKTDLHDDYFDIFDSLFE